MTRRDAASSYAKRGTDIVLSVSIICASAPMMSLVALALRFSTKGSAFVRQRRAGIHGEPFVLYKLRTMTDERDARGRLMADAVRLTPLGRLVRSLSIDELPQLLNVLKGEMSIVGPRPLPVEYAGLYTEEESERSKVRPGITGWAQVNGRHTTTFSRRLAYDVWYVRHWSHRLDLQIMFLTASSLLRRTDVHVVQDLEAVDDRGFAKLLKHVRL